MKVTLIKGDGIGPEVVSSACRVIEAVCPDIEYDGVGVELRDNEPVLEPIISSIKKNKIGLKGPITTPIGSGFRSINISLRKALNLYAGVRPARSYDKNIDIVVIRENTEGLYAGVEYPVGSDSSCAVRVITKGACNKIIRFAFEYARKNKRKKVTAVHKANILKLSCGLFLDTARNVALDYPDIGFEDKLVDNTCMQLAKKPDSFDIIVTTNLFGDIISDLCAGLIGGLGVAPGANIGDEYAIFEPVHGSCPKYAGLNQANPIATILSSVMMLKYIGRTKEAEKIENAIAFLLEKGIKTKDLGGNYTHSQMRDEIIREVISFKV